MQCFKTQHEWHPQKIVFDDRADQEYAVLVLNRPIDLPMTTERMLNLWEHAKVRITVDGGTDQWLSYLNKHKIDCNSIKPIDLITGDMDSILDETLSQMRTHKHTQVIVTEDQNATDFTKALLELKKYTEKNPLSKVQQIAVICDTSGRCDQILSNINTLFKMQDINPHWKAYIFANESLTWILPVGSNIIHIPEKSRTAQDWCGLVPIGSPCEVTTSGLKWNLNKSIMKFAHLISTSNTYDGEPQVTVLTDNPLMWSMGNNNLFTT